MAGFKPGDLAMLTVPSNFGLTVELISLHYGPCRLHHSHGYQDIPAGSAGWLVSGDGIVSSDSFGTTEVVNQLAFRPKWLMPLRGDEQPQQQKHQEPTT